MVQDNTVAIANCYRQLGIDVTFEINPGGHFEDIDFRSTKGIVAI